jgi:molybdopterin synthase sulfur carrier subunit
MDDSDLVKDKEMASAHAETVTILYFARLKEVFGRASERVALPPAVETVGALREHLRARGGVWETELASAGPVRVAVNQEMAAPSARLRPGDEVAFFPPVTGG